MKPVRWSVVADLTVAAFAGLLALAVYARSMAPGLLWGDSAEFQFAAWLGGFAHPTGYPLFLMLGWLWTHLIPFGDPAFRMNLFSVLWGGVAVALVCLVMMRLLRFVGDRAPGGPVRLVSLGAALVFAFTPTFWSQAVIAEVYTLHAAFIAALLLTLLIWAERVFDGQNAGAKQQMFIVVLLIGLSLTHHRSTLLLIPAVALFALIVLGRGTAHLRLTPRQAVLLVVCLVTPLLLYLAIPLRAPHIPYYRVELTPDQSLPLYNSTVAGFLAHISGSVFSTSLISPQGSPLDFNQVAVRFVDEVSLNGLILGGLGLGWLLIRGIFGKDRPAWALLALTATFSVSQIAFNLLYAIGDIHVFYIPAYLVWVLWIGVGAWSLGRVVASLMDNLDARMRRFALVAGAGVALTLLLALTYRSIVVYWPTVQRANDDSAQRAWEALLTAELPPDSILVSNDRDEMTPLWYVQYVQGRRQDLTGLFPRLQGGTPWATVTRVTDVALGTGRPVYLVKPMQGMALKYDLTPVASKQVGPLGPPVSVRGLPKAAPYHVVDLLYGDTVRLSGYDLVPDPVAPGQSLQIVLYWEPVRLMRGDWTTFVQVLNAEDTKLGQSDHRPGGDFYPSSLWAPGDRLADTHGIALPAELGPGPYRLIAGLYILPSEPLRHLGEPQLIGETGSAR